MTNKSKIEESPELIAIQYAAKIINHIQLNNQMYFKLWWNERDV